MQSKSFIFWDRKQSDKKPNNRNRNYIPAYLDFQTFGFSNRLNWMQHESIIMTNMDPLEAKSNDIQKNQKT